MAKKKTLDLKELKYIYETLGNGKSKLALSLLDKAEFLETTLNELKKEVEQSGVITKMCQGEYEIDRENPALKSYNTTIKNYTTVVKQLNDMLPIKNENSNNDGFDEFGDT